MTDELKEAREIKQLLDEADALELQADIDIMEAEAELDALLAELDDELGDELEEEPADPVSDRAKASLRKANETDDSSARDKASMFWGIDYD